MKMNDHRTMALTQMKKSAVALSCFGGLVKNNLVKS